jgi:hypothetical protein
MSKTFLIFIGLLVLASAIILATYRFSIVSHRDVVDHKPAMLDIPGSMFYNVSMTGSDNGRAFSEHMRAQTKQIEMPAFRMNVTLNSPQYFRLLALAEAKPAMDTEEIYNKYKKRFDFENNVVFTVMMHSASGNLFDYKLDSSTFLRSNGTEYRPTKWIESKRSSSYHRRGMLVFKNTPGMENIKLVIKDTSGSGTGKVLEWEEY